MNIKCSWILEGAPAIASRTLNWEIKIGISNFQSTQSRAWENILTVIAFFSTTALTVIKAIGFWLFLSRGQTFSLTRSSGCYWKCGLFASCCFHGLCPEGSAGVCESCMALGVRELYDTVPMPLTLVSASFSASKYWTLGP